MSFPRPFFRWRPHPWHGLEVGPEPPQRVHAYIEITPFDLIKYEIDKTTGYLRVDRPQRGSSQPPTLYGFIPRTFCGPRVGELSPKSSRGDGDPLDICVLSERQITRAEVIVNASIVGGLQMVDNGEADDKVIAVLEGDNVWGGATDLDRVPAILVERLIHYFTTYKLLVAQSYAPQRMTGDLSHGAPSAGSQAGMPAPPATVPVISIEQTYGREHALAVVRAAIADYDESYA